MVKRVAAFVLILSSLASAAEAAVLPPTSKWVVNYADSMCVLQREYGTATQPLTLAFRPQPMSSSLTVYLFDQPANRESAYVPVSINFGSQATAVKKTLATFDVRRMKSRVNETHMALEELERAAASEVIEFDAGKRLQVGMSVPGLRNALVVLDDCIADLLATWDFSRQQQQAMATPPKSIKSLSTYVSPSDYPMQALREDESGANSARFRIDSSGKVSDCQIVESSNSDSLDKSLCRVVGRYRFHPAIDKSGIPMDSIGFVRIRWMLA